jgi:aromatic-L-amino-acid decarboxylase
MSDQTENDGGKNSRQHSLEVDAHALERLSQLFVSLTREYFGEIRQLPVFPERAADFHKRIDPGLPWEGTHLDDIAVECRAIIEGGRQNGHPRFFGYVASPSTAPGVFADLLASAINQNVTCWRSSPSATEIERLVVRWLGELTGFGSGSPGILTSGGSMANLNALTMAHRAKCGFDVSNEGLSNSGPLMTLYASNQVHHSILKAADLIGLGRKNVRLIKSDERYHMDLRALRMQIEEDLRKGVRPFCVVGTAGTVSTGAVDPLAEIAEIARDYNLWFHVDGAYGGPAAMEDSRRALFAGIELADSMSIDAHKWLYCPVDCGCLLFRDEVKARQAFSEASEADYIKVHETEGDEAFAFWDYGIELSRRFRGLKLWMLLKYFGIAKIAASIGEDCRLASYMANRIESDDEFELLAPVQLSICCFRFVPRELRNLLSTRDNSDEINRRLDALNAAIMLSVQRSGHAYLSNATLRGRYALRACIVNFRTTRADIDMTLDLVRETAARLIKKEGR